MTESLRLLALCASPRVVPFFLPIYDYMRERGHQTHIALPPSNNGLPISASTQHRYHFVDIARNIAPASDFACLLQLIKLMRQLKPQLVHAHGPKAGLLGMSAAAITGVPARVYSVHGLRHETLVGAKLQLVKRLESVSARLAHEVICVSESVRTRAEQDALFPASRAKMMAQGSAAGIDAESQFVPENERAAGLEIRASLGLNEGDLLVGFVGRFARDKGIVELGEAMALVQQQLPHVHLLMVGEPDPTDPVSLAALRSLARVHFFSHQQQPAPFFAALDLLVLPTYREGFPQVLLEAAAMEIPAVASRVTGCVDAIIDGQTGRLVAPRDPVALAQGILTLLADPDGRKAMGKAARRRVLTEFRSEPIAQQTLALYLDVLKRTEQRRQF